MYLNLIRKRYLLSALVCMWLCLPQNGVAQTPQMSFEVEIEKGQADPDTDCGGSFNVSVTGTVPFPCEVDDKEAMELYIIAVAREAESIALVRGNNFCGLYGGKCNRGTCSGTGLALMSLGSPTVTRTTDDDDKEVCILRATITYRISCGCK